MAITILSTDNDGARISQDGHSMRLAWPDLRRLATAGKHAEKYSRILATAEAHRASGSTEPLDAEHVQRCARCKRFLPAASLRADVTVQFSESYSTEDKYTRRDVCIDEAACAKATA